jgi:hypothetical protein
MLTQRDGNFTRGKKSAEPGSHAWHSSAGAVISLGV